VNNRFW